MSSAIAPLSQRPASAAPLARHKAIAPLHLRKFFVDDPARGESLALASVGVYRIGSPSSVWRDSRFGGQMQ
jgi:hypothetical protein